MSITSTPASQGILCGNCKHHHASVAEVRACHLGAQAMNQAMDQFSSPAAKGRAHSTLMASQKQINFLTTLFTERGRDEIWIANRIKGLSMSQASTLIGETLRAPKVTQTVVAPQLTAPKVPAGRYALDIDGVVKFFKVDCPTDGPWAGRTFVKIQASDELHRVSRETAQAVLVLVAKDPEAASKRYGRELGHCGVCGRTLTDENSRANGIGPICADKAGW